MKSVLVSILLDDKGTMTSLTRFGIRYMVPPIQLALSVPPVPVVVNGTFAVTALNSSDAFAELYYSASLDLFLTDDALPPLIGSARHSGAHIIVPQPQG